MENLKLELKDEAGVIMGTIELPVEELTGSLGLESALTGIVAQIKESIG